MTCHSIGLRRSYTLGVVVMAMCVCVCSVYCGRWGAVKGGVGKQDLDRKWKGSPKYLGMVGGGEACY